MSPYSPPPPSLVAASGRTEKVLEKCVFSNLMNFHGKKSEAMAYLLAPELSRQPF